MASSTSATTNSEACVLGRFEPGEYQEDRIEREFRALPFLPACCRKERISVRVPHDRAAAPNPDNLAWHQDGGGPAGTTDHMVIWSSEMPTNLRSSSGELFPIEPFDVVWFNNRIAFHKQPEGTDETRRWFVAIRCSGAL